MSERQMTSEFLLSKSLLHLFNHALEACNRFCQCHAFCPAVDLWGNNTRERTLLLNAFTSVAFSPIDSKRFVIVKSVFNCSATEIQPLGFNKTSCSQTLHFFGNVESLLLLIMLRTLLKVIRNLLVSLFNSSSKHFLHV